MDLALDNQQWLICQKTNQPTNLTNSFTSFTTKRTFRIYHESNLFTGKHRLQKQYC